MTTKDKIQLIDKQSYLAYANEADENKKSVSVKEANNQTVIRVKSAVSSACIDDRTVFVNPTVDNCSEKQDCLDKHDKINIQLHPESEPDNGATRYFNPSIHQSIQTKDHHSISDLMTVSTDSVINKRFVLKEVLGVGGMGKVYKALDLRKQEAHDKNPFIAIKLLNDEFREHPESLIALQREARKSQQLSHPNIVNVHDFDRDGDVVFMTMELLRGRPLDQVIAEDYPHGVPESEATPIINAVANAVLYAHQHGIIHSDLKPSNVFITDDNIAKIFDFGIARACHLSHGQSEDHNSNKTLFDPTELGALTPTYASLEMLEGKSPEPHDDIYSIACVFYELLTGNHPYKRLPADKAKEKKLKVKQISAFGQSQHKEKSKALLKALEIEGENRYSNIEQFLKSYNYRKKSRKPAYFSILTSLIFLLIVFFPQIMEQYEFSKQTRFIERVLSIKSELKDEDLRSIRTHISLLHGSTKAHVLKSIKNKWLSLVEVKVDSLYTDNTENQYHKIDELLLISQSYYSDSAQVARLFELFEKQKFVQLNQLNSHFNELIETLQFSELTSDSVEQEQIFEIVSSIKQIDIAHPLIQDQRLLLIYQDNVERFFSELKTEEAKSLLAKARVIFPNEIILQNLIDQLKSIKTDDSNEMIHSQEINEPLSTLNISKLKEQLSLLILNPELTDDWDKQVTTLYSQLSLKLGRHSIWLNEKNQTLATLYLQKSVAMRDDKRFVESRRFLEKAKQYNNAIFGLKDEEAILIALENIVRVRHKAKQQLVKIEGLKMSLSIQLKAEEMESALRTYEDLKRILGRNDPYISSEAKQAIAQSFYKQANTLFIVKKYDKTLKVVNNGLKFESYHSGLRSLRKKAEKQKKLLSNSRLMAQQASQLKAVNKILVEEKQNKEQEISSKIFPKLNDTCKAKFAGYGKQRRANCNDLIGKHIKAPTLVVLPGKKPGEQVFAISKYEITIKDFNNYCQLSGGCSMKKGRGSLPITSIPITDVKNYVNWLSKTTHRQYSIPTSDQWLHAAKTNKPVSYNDVNCRIKFGSKLLKGQNLLAANTGQSNPWGIMNIIGNASEYVIDNNQTIVRGGSYQDSIKDCTIEYMQKNVAQGNSSTGFRVIRLIN